MLLAKGYEGRASPSTLRFAHYLRLDSGDTSGEVVREVLRGEQEGAVAGVEGEVKELEVRGKISYLWG